MKVLSGKHWFIAFSVLAFLVSCNSGNNFGRLQTVKGITDSDATATNYDKKEENQVAVKDAVPLVKPENPVKKMIKDGRMGMKVLNLESTKKEIDAILKQNNAYYSGENFTNTDYEMAYNLKIRVPEANFERLVSEVEKGDGEITYKEIQARDVTEQFIDIETRLSNKRNYLNRYTELLAQTKKIEEILSIEERIRALQEEIESAEGTLKYLNDQVDFSTLDLYLSKTKEFKFTGKNRSDFFERLKHSLSGGWHGFISFVLFLIRIWPFWLVVLVFYIVFKRFKRKRKSK